MPKNGIKPLVSFAKTAIHKLRSQPPAKLLLFALLVLAVFGLSAKTAGSLWGTLFPARYTPCPDLSVEITAISDDSGYFVVRNTGNYVICDFTLAFVGFDSNGNMVELGWYNDNKYGEVTYTSANILPGQVYGPWDSSSSFRVDSGVKYAVATVSKVTYQNGREWAAQGLSRWAKEEEKNFSIDSYNRLVEHMRTDATKAESASDVNIISSEKYNDNRYSNSDDLKVAMINTGQCTIKDIHFLLLQYDANGYAVGNRFGGYYCVRNAKSIQCTDANLVAGKAMTAEWSLLFESQCRTYKLLPYKAEYTDGTIWKNEYAMQWMLYNENKR